MLIVGLGNPGDEYKDTLHNCGFAVVDALAEKLGKKIEKLECRALTCVTQINGEKTVLAKPLTYMNESGVAVASLMARYHMTPDDLIVCYDDIDIGRYTVRVRLSGSAGTHNGMRSVVADIGTEKFRRLRVGVGGNEYDLKDYVLSRITKEDKPHFAEVFSKAADVLYTYLTTGDGDRLMREGNSIR